MKLFFDNVNFNSTTGPNTFASRLARELIDHGHEITDSVNCDVHLSFIEQVTPKNNKSVLVQRLDGIWFKPEEFISMNSGIKRTYQNSDFVVWQSYFDKTMVTKWWGEKTGEVFHNGINLSRISVTNKDIASLRASYKLMFVCSASWHRQKRLKENIELFLKIKDKYPDSCLVVMGSNPDFLLKHKDIFYTGPLPHDICLQFFSAADWMIHLAWLDHCPNVVVESLSQLCPVICTDSGGTKEIVRKNGIILSEDKKYEYDLLDYDDPYDLSVVSLDLPTVQIDNSYLDIKKVAQKYIRVLEELI